MLRKPFLILVLFCATIPLFSQNLTRSPYSGLGVGDLQFYGFGQQQSLGRITQSIRSTSDYSIANPASYTALNLFTVYQAGLNMARGNVSSSTQNQNVQTASLGYFSLAVPINRKYGWGGAFGLQPYSAVGYKSFTENIDSNLGYKQNLQEGEGGINRFYMGTGIRLHKNFSVGFNASYMFGQLVSTDKIYFHPDSSHLDYREDRTRFLGGFNFDIGIQYHDTLIKDTNKIANNSWVITAGATYHMGTTLNARQELYARTIYTVQGSDYRRDTVVFSEGQKGTLNLPSALSVGVGIGNSGKENRWFFAGEYFMQNWQDYTSYGAKSNLANLQSVSVGLSYQPRLADIEADISKKYYNYIQYKGGFRYANTQLMVGNTQITEYGINVGLSLPVKIYKIVSFIHLGAEYNSRGTTKDNLIRENYYRFVLGLSLTDVWFKKYKYD